MTLCLAEVFGFWRSRLFGGKLTCAVLGFRSMRKRCKQDPTRSRNDLPLRVPYYGF